MGNLRAASGGGLLCDKCGGPGARKRACPHKVTLAGLPGKRQTLAWCKPNALCSPCLTAIGGSRVLHAACAAPAKADQVEEDAKQAGLDAGRSADEDDPAVQAERDRCMPQACGRCGGEVPRDGAPPDHLDGCVGPLPPQPAREEMIAAGCLDGGWPETISVFSDAHAEHMRVNGDCPWCGSYDTSKWLKPQRRRI